MLAIPFAPVCSKLTWPPPANTLQPCDRKGGAEGLPLPSLAPHIMSSFWYHLSRWRSGLTPGKKGVSSSLSRVTLGYPEPCLFTSEETFTSVAAYSCLPLISAPLSPVGLGVLMVRSELENQSILPVPHPLSHPPSQVTCRNLTLGLRRIKLWARISVWSLSLSLMLKSTGPKEISQVPSGRLVIKVNRHNSQC